MKMRRDNHLTTFLTQFKPRFWHSGRADGQGQTLFNYRRFWLFSITLRSLVSLVPLVILFVFTYMLESKAIRNENYLQTIRLTSNTRRTLTYFLEERLDALKFITQKNKVLTDYHSVELSDTLQDLKMGFGGFVDLGLIDTGGRQISYAGPFNLKDKNYSDQDWFKKCIENGSYISDVFLGHRKLPHLIVALRWATQQGDIYLLRATLDVKKLIQILSSLELSARSDAFLINHAGLVQTPSKYYGELLKKTSLPIPEFSEHTQVMESVDSAGHPILIGYAYIESSPYILMLVKRSHEIMKGWNTIRREINWFFGISVIATLIVVLSISTFMANKIYDADQTRLRAMERLEGSSRLISLGRLAAGVAHEINNPLAIIGENAGLIKDIFDLKKQGEKEQQLIDLNNAVLESVERCGEVTKQLLEFARHFELKIQPLRLNEIVSSVLSFLKKEASYRSIHIKIDIPDDFPVIYSDQGSLQQIFLNLINNAFQAMNNGGRLEIIARKQENDMVSIAVADNGSGISAQDQKKIFDPFFTTKGLKGGTGLGLSITYGLVRKLKGDIAVHSKVGEGTTFTLILPVKQAGDVKNESLTR